MAPELAVLPAAVPHLFCADGFYYHLLHAAVPQHHDPGHGAGAFPSVCGGCRQGDILEHPAAGAGVHPHRRPAAEVDGGPARAEDHQGRRANHPGGLLRPGAGFTQPGRGGRLWGDCRLLQQNGPGALRHGDPAHGLYRQCLPRAENAPGCHPELRHHAPAAGAFRGKAPGVRQGRHRRLPAARQPYHQHLKAEQAGEPADFPPSGNLRFGGAAVPVFARL